MDGESARIGPGPFAALLGFRVMKADEDGSVVEADPEPEHLNGGGIVHGGFLAALLDSATGWAVHARYPAGVAVPHVGLNVQYVRAAVGGTPLTATGRCVNAGRRAAAAEAEVTQDGRVVARAMTNHFVIDPQ